MERMTVQQAEREAWEAMDKGQYQRAFALMIVTSRARAEMARARKGKGVKVGKA